MVAVDQTQYFRYAIDFGALVVPSILGITPYNVYLITITNDPVGFNDASTNRTVSQTRIALSGGASRSYIPGDGFINPGVSQLNGEQLMVSNGQIVANQIMLGPLVFPYNVNGISGGYNPTIFQPAVGTSTSKEIYIQLQGPGLSPSGNFFDVKKLVLNGMSNITYRLLLEATLTNPSLV